MIRVNSRSIRTPKLADVAEWLSNLPDLSCITDECEGDKENLFDEQAAPVSVLPCTSLGSSNTPKRLRLSLARPSKEATTVAFKESTNQRVSHFAVPVDSPEREKAAKGVVPAKTEANTQWALRNFNAWALHLHVYLYQDISHCALVMILNM